MNQEIAGHIIPGDPLPSLQYAEQNMGMPALRRRWTTADVRALMNESRHWPRYELIAGELQVTPAPGSLHQFAVQEIALLLGNHLRVEPVGAVLTSPADLELVPGTIVQPDVFVIAADTVIAGDRLEWTDVRSLLLAVEVLSAASGRTDRVVKRDYYMDAGVAEYWIVDLDARVIERWTPEQSSPTIERDRLTWNPGSTPLVVDVAALFRRIDGTARSFKKSIRP
jgi:Uma2 family endonuclease